MVRSWKKSVVVCLLVGSPIGLWARTSGPDASGLILIDSAEDEGPPHVWIDASSGSVEPPGLVALPFPFRWGEESQTLAQLGLDGSLLFVEGPVSCPGTGGWSGAVTGGTGTPVHRIIGRYPHRGAMWDWGESQLVLLERRSEMVIRVGESDDDWLVGAQTGSGSGVSWACTDGRVIADRSAWISDEGARSVAAMRSTDHLEHAWWGSRAAEFFGESIATGDVNGDGLTDVLVGEPEGNKAFLFYGHRTERGSESERAELVIAGPSGSRFGHAVELTDLDGDGFDDVVVTAPRDAGGSAYVFLAEAGLYGEMDSVDATSVVRAPVEADIGGMGQSMAVGDVTGDGTPDLVLGAPNSYFDSLLVGGVWVAADRAWSDPEQTLVEGDGFWGDEPGGQAGFAVATADFARDGVSEIVVSDPYADMTGSDSGRVFVLSYASSAERLVDAATVTIDGDNSGDLFGTSLAVGDLDGSGLSDLVVGAVGRNDFGSSTGGIEIFLDLAFHRRTIVSSDADLSIVGSEGAQAAGASITVGQLDDDEADELVVGAPGGISLVGGGGLVAVFRDVPDGDTSLDDADHRLIGAGGSGDVGADVAVAMDLQGNGYPDLLVAAPLDTPEFKTAAGAVWVWPFLPAYLDDDADGFVAHASGGLDCNDASDRVHPNRDEVASNGVDDDCDGWVDGLFIPRQLEQGWRYDIDDVLGVTTPEKYDFEDSSDGAAVADHYSTRGLTLFAEGVVRTQDNVWGAAPVGALGARVTAGGSANDLMMRFGSPIDAIGMRILDAEVLMRMDAVLEDELVVNGFEFRADGPDRPGGIFQGFTFAAPVDTVRIAASSPNGWGVDDIEVVYAISSDRDGDGLSVADGDCDDFNASVGPGVEERLGDGVDNDCDGVVDGGFSDVFLTEGSFVATVSIIGERIDFEEPEVGASITDFYRDRGASFADGVNIVSRVGDGMPIDTQAGSVTADALQINFTEHQPAVAFWLIDAVGTISLEARRDGILLYENVLPTGTEGFVGIAFPVPVDSLRIAHSVSGDEWGIDNLTFSALGLDDADGDGFTEADGDCDDAEALAYPGGTESWYDGIDGDCLGDDDFDADGDGHSSMASGGFDCDDFLAETFPGAEDDWYDGVDSDCAGDDDFDSDGDGHRSVLFGGTDCDDSSAAVSPDAEEVFYDDVDDDCDPTTDFDADGDGFALSGFPGAIGLYGVGDCDDGEGTTYPGAEETWYDGLDSDCAGDDDFDADGDGHIPLAFGGTDCDDDASGSSPDVLFDECYDGLDSDCDEHSDFDCDRDGYDDVEFGGWDCDDTDATIFPGDGVRPDGPDLDCDGFVAAEFGGDDCDDSDAETHPGATDIWYDGRDDDCDGADDFDRDGDGYRVAAWADDPSLADCDDGDDGVHPGITVDDCAGGDEDCDGVVDEDCRPVEDTATETDGSAAEPESDITESEDGDPAEEAELTDSAETEIADTGASEDELADDESGESTADVTVDDTGMEPLSSSGNGRRGRKDRECGCYSAKVAPSWIWLVPVVFAVGRRRLR